MIWHRPCYRIVVCEEIKMLSKKQTINRFEINSNIREISHKANLANAEPARLKADNETASPNFALWDLDEKKEQFLTIDRF